MPALTVSNGSITGAGQSAVPATLDDATVTTPNLTDTLTLSGNLTGTGPLTKNGNGLLILSGSDSYSDGTIVTAGTLEITAANALPDRSSLNVALAARSSSILPRAARRWYRPAQQLRRCPSRERWRC